MRNYNVIHDIKALDCGTEFNALNFEATSRTVAMPRGGTREEPEYIIMPRLGFSVMTMNTTELGIIIEAAPCGAYVLPDI